MANLINLFASNKKKEEEEKKKKSSSTGSQAKGTGNNTPAATAKTRGVLDLSNLTESEKKNKPTGVIDKLLTPKSTVKRDNRNEINHFTGLQSKQDAYNFSPDLATEISRLSRRGLSDPITRRNDFISDYNLGIKTGLFNNNGNTLTQSTPELQRRRNILEQNLGKAKNTASATGSRQDALDEEAKNTWDMWNSNIIRSNPMKVLPPFLYRDSYYDDHQEEMDKELYETYRGKGSYERDWVRGNRDSKLRVMEDLKELWADIDNGTAQKVYDAQRNANQNYRENGMSAAEQKRLQRELDAANKELEARDTASRYIQDAPEPVEGFIPGYKQNTPKYNTSGQMALGLAFGTLQTPNMMDKADSVYDAVMYKSRRGNPWNEVFGQDPVFGEDAITWEEYNSLQPAQFMSDEQRNAFRGYYENGDPQSAMAFYNVIEPQLTQMMLDSKDEYEKYLSQDSSYSGVMIGKRIVENPMAGMLGLYGTIEALRGSEEAQNPNNALYWLTRQNANIQDARAKVWGRQFKEWFGGNETAEQIGEFLNGVAYSIGDNLFATAIGQGLSTTLAGEASTKLATGAIQFIMSSEATASEMYNRLESGMDPEEAALRALGTGAVEWVTEKVSIEALLNPDIKNVLKDPKKLWAYLAKNSFAEGSEEVNSDVLGVVLDVVLSSAYDHEKEFQQKLKAAAEEYGEDEALKHVLLDYAGQMSMSALAGGIAGLGTAAGYSTAALVGEHVNTSKIGEAGLNSRNITEAKVDEADTRTDSEVRIDNAFNMIEAGMKMPEGSESRKLAAELQEGMKNGKKLSNYEFGKLTKAIISETDAEMGKIAKDVLTFNMTKSLRENGAENAEQLGTIVMKKYMGEELTDEENELFRNSSAAQRTLMNYTFDMRTKVDMNAAVAKATEGIKSIQENVTNLFKEGGRELKSGVEKMFEGATTAAKADVLMAGGSKGTGTEVLADGKILDIDHVEMQKNADGEQQLMLFPKNGGEAVAAADVKAVDGNMAKALQFFTSDGMKTISNRFANVMMKHVKDIRDIGTAMNDALNVRLDTMFGKTNTKTQLSDATVQEIREATLQDFEEAEEQRVSSQKQINPGEGKTSFNGAEFGTKEFGDAIKGLSKNIRQEAYAIGEIAKAAGFDVQLIYDETNTKMQGWFSATGDGVTINLAGENAGGEHHSALATLSHEITHWLEANSKEAYARLRQFVFGSLENEGVNLRQRLEGIIDNYAHNDVDIDLNGAMAEMVAQGCDQILTNEDVIAHMKESEPGLFGDIRKAVANLINRVRSAISRMKGSMSYESRNLQGYMDQLGKLWNLAYDEARGKVVDAETINREAASVQASVQDDIYDEAGKDAELQRLKAEAEKYRKTRDSARNKYNSLIKSDDMKAFNDRIAKTNTDEENNKLIEEMLAWQEENGLDRLKNEADEAERKLKEAQKAYDNYQDQILQKTEQRMIEDSGMNEADWRRKQAINQYGYTGDYREAGYLLPTGRMLNFTGSKGQHYGMRGNDHRDIGIVYATKQGSEAMNAFMNDGNIRVMAETPGVDIAKEPTTAQYTAIRNMAARFAGEEYFSVDFSDERGNNIGSLEYDGHVNPSKVVNDIRTFFRTGQVPQQSLASQFHYSVQDDAAYMDAVKKGDMETAQRMVDQAAKDAGYNLAVYHGTGDDFNEFERGNEGIHLGDYSQAGQMATIKNIFYGKQNSNVKKLYAKMSNPFVINGDVGTWMPQIIAKVLMDRDAGETKYGYYGNYVDISGSEISLTEEQSDKLLDLEDEDEWEVKDEYWDIIADVLNQNGYDGIKYLNEYEGDKKSYSYIALRPGDVKSADAVTRDDNGNVIPLSKRFNEKQNDIRYSITDDGEIKNDNGQTIAKVIDGQTAVKYSYQTWTPEEQARVLDDLKKSGFTKKEIVNWMADVNSIASIIASNRDRWDFDPTEGQFYLKDNAEYIKTLDASTLCAKRILYQGTFNEIQKQLPNTPLMPADLIDLLNIMKEHEDVVPCSICYVESRRKNLGKFTAKWLANYKGEYRPKIVELTTTDGLEKLKKEHRKAYDDYVAAMNKTGTSNPKVVQMRTAYNGDINKLTENEIRKIVALGGLRVQSFSDFETVHMLDMMQAVMDMASRKLTSQAYTKVPNFAWVFGNTGIKINLSLIGAGNGLDADGNLIFDDVEGMPHGEAFKIRDAYSKNVGTILVGINDDHIIAAMGDKRIDFIIPFHKSGWSKDEFARIGTLRNYRDYTYFQNERVILGQRKVTVNKKTEDSMKKWLRGQSKWMTGYTVTKTEKGYRIDAHGYGSISFKNEKDAADARFKAENSEERATARSNFNPVGEGGYWNWKLTGPQNAEAYLRKCKEDGRLPKFWQYLQDNGDGSFSLPQGKDKRSTAIREGYWKTLIDFKMYDNEGNAAKQMPVKPNFNMEQARRVMEEYEAPEGGNNALPKDMDVAKEFVEQYKKKHPRKSYSIQDIADQEARHWLDTVNINSLETEAEKVLLNEYRGLDIKVKLQREREENISRQLKPLMEIPEDQRTNDQKRMIEKLNIRLENTRHVREQAQEKMGVIAGEKGYGRMMREHNRTYNNFMYGKTQQEVNDIVLKMEESAREIEERIRKNQSEIAELEKSDTVQAIKKALGGTTTDKAAGELKKRFNSSWTKNQIRTFLDPILVKMAALEDVSNDVGEMAGILIRSNKDLAGLDQDLDELRGETIVLNDSQLRELKGQNSSLKEVRSRLAGTGIKVISGKNGAKGTLVEDLESFTSEYPFLAGEIDTNGKNALESFLTWVEGRKDKGLETIDMNEALADGMASIYEIAAQAVDRTGIYEPKDPKAKKQIEDLLAYIRGLDARTEAAEKTLNDIAKSMGGIRSAGQQAAGMTTVLTQNISEALDYYNKTAKLAMDTAKRQKQSAIIEQLKSEQAKKILKNNEEWRNLIERDRQARMQAEKNAQKRNVINTDIKRMYRLLRDQSATKNMPEYMQALARDMIGAFVSNDISGVKVLRADPEQLAEATRLLRAWTEQNGAATYGNIMDNLDEAEEAIGQALMLDRDVIYQTLNEWNSEVKGKNKLDTIKKRGEILERMQAAVSEIYNAIQAERTVQANKRRVTTQDAAFKVMVETKGKKYREWTGKAGSAIRAMHKMIVGGNMTPEYFFRTLNNGGLNDLWTNYHDAENRNGLELHKAQERLAEIAKTHGYQNWDMGQKLRVDIGGEQVEMTLGQMMSLWATWKRENTLGPAMSEHLSKGGFYVEQDLREGILGRAEVQKKAHRVTIEDMARVGALLSEEQTAFINDVVGFMSNEMSQLGNEASMAAYGIKLYKEKYYFPFQMWDGIKSRKSNDSGNGANIDQAFHPSFSKTRLHGANNALVIGDFMQTASDHIAGMINYATMGLANDSMQKVLNEKMNDAMMVDGNPQEGTVRNIRAILEEAYGREAVQYLAELQKQLNGGAVRIDKTVYDKAISLFRKNAVAGSLSVAAQQPLSYLRAATMIDAKYLGKALTREYWQGSYKELLQHSGVAVIKEMGRFDMNAGQSAREYLTPDGLKTKWQAAWDQITDKATILPEKMDAWTWTRMWVAVKAEQHAEHPEMDMKSDEFLDMCGERFNDIMRRTQVYDSVLVRSENMRSQNPWVKSITSFMAEPTLTLNVLADAVRSAKAGEKGGKALLAKAGATFAISAALQAAVKALFSSGRSPDDKKTWLENWEYRFISNLINEADPVQMIPGYSDLISLLKEGKLEDDAMGAVGKMISAGRGMIDVVLGNGQKGLYRDMEDSAGQLVQLFTNLPAKNIMRDLRAAYNWFIDPPYTGRPTERSVIENQTIEAIANADNLWGWINKELGDAGYQAGNKAYYQRIYEAKKAGDEKRAQSMIDYLIKGKGVKPDTITNSVNNIAKKDGSADAADTAKFLINEGSTSADDYIKAGLKAGTITEADAKKLLKEADPKATDNDIWWTVDRIKYQNDTGADNVSGNYYRFYDAMEQNKSGAINEAVKMMLGHGMEAKNIKTQITKKYKSDYLAANNGGKVKLRNAIQLAYKALGFTAADADKVIDGWEKDKKSSSKTPAKNEPKTDSFWTQMYSKTEGSLYGKGNIDLNNRKPVKNKDGSISTEYSITVGFDDGIYVLPTVINGRIVSEEQAIRYFERTGEYLGKFKTQKEADEYAEKLHQRQDWYYNKR